MIVNLSRIKLRTLSYSVLRCFEYCCDIGLQPQSSKTWLSMAWLLGLWALGNATAVTPSKQLLSLPIWSYLPYFKAFTTSNNLAVRRLELLRPPSALRELVKKEPRASGPGSQDITCRTWGCIQTDVDCCRCKSAHFSVHGRIVMQRRIEHPKPGSSLQTTSKTKTPCTFHMRPHVRHQKSYRHLDNFREYRSRSHQARNPWRPPSLKTVRSFLAQERQKCQKKIPRNARKSLPGLDSADYMVTRMLPHVCICFRDPIHLASNLHEGRLVTTVGVATIIN